MAARHITKNQSSCQKARNSAAKQKPEIARVNLAMEKIEGRGHQPHDSRKNEGRANGLARGEPGKKQ